MMRKKVTACLNFGPNWQSLAVLKNGQTPIQLLTLIMDSGWSKSQIAPKIGLKIPEFYGATYLLKEFFATINFLNRNFFLFLHHCGSWKFHCSQLIDQKIWHKYAWLHLLNAKMVFTNSNIWLFFPRNKR